ncbi:hypothetical protein [Endozoicomonas sp.]|uniref:hypothetical protein n=1 Tax=Endozoicomonas sp. TaxID=1892382 RepID=UPI003AF90C70
MDLSAGAGQGVDLQDIPIPMDIDVPEDETPEKSPEAGPSRDGVQSPASVAGSDVSSLLETFITEDDPEWLMAELIGMDFSDLLPELEQ